MLKVYILLFLMALVLAKQDTAAYSTYGSPDGTNGGTSGGSTGEQTTPTNDAVTPQIKYYYYDDLVFRLNDYRRENANMFKDIEIDLESKESSLAELKRLLNDIDTFSEHKDFETTYETTYSSPPQFCEFICKLHKQYDTNAKRCIDLWDKKPLLRDHMKLEYATGGSTCAQYGNGVLCVMHVREFQKTVATTIQHDVER